MFEPFFTTKPVGEGTGLGLELTRRMVMEPGGDVHVRSEPGRTVFHVQLPAAATRDTVPAVELAADLGAVPTANMVTSMAAECHLKPRHERTETPGRDCHGRRDPT